MNGKSAVIKLPKPRVQNNGNPFGNFATNILLAPPIEEVNKPVNYSGVLATNYYRLPAMICFPKKVMVPKSPRPYCRP